MSQAKSPSRRSTAGTTVQIILGAFGWIFVLFPIILCTTIPLLLLQKVHHLLARIFRKDLQPITNPIETLLVLKPSIQNPAGNGCQIWRLKGSLDLKALRDHFQSLFLSTPELRESYRNLYCYFEQWGLYMFKKRVETESLNLDEMIQELHWDYGNQGKDTEDEEALDGFIGKWMSTSDYGRSPCWRILIIQLDKTGESVMLFKCDHGLTDGLTFANIVSKLSGNKMPYIVQEQNFTTVTKLKYILSFPALLFEYSWRFCVSGKVPFPDFTPSIKSTVDSEWLISFGTLNLQKVKKVRQLTKSHFNTVLATIQVGATRRYCQEFGNVQSFPKTCFIPSPTGLPNHPAMAEETMCNHLTFTGMFIPFKEEDCLQRLLEAEANYLYSSNIGLDILCDWIFLKLFMPMPPCIMLFLIYVANSVGIYPGEQSISPLMLSGEKYQLLGHPVEHLTLPALVPLFIRPAHLVMVPSSNSGRLDLSVNGTKKIFKTQKDLDRYTKIYLKEELDSLLAAAVNSTTGKMV